MSNGFSKERDAAFTAVLEASRLCQTVQSKIDEAFLQKKDRSPVTVADFGSQALICRRLKDAFPDDPIIGEEDSTELRKSPQKTVLDRVVRHVHEFESGAPAGQICRWIDYGGSKEYSERFWTLDPIDGTKGFLRKEQYAISLALIVDGEIKVGAVACPNLPVSPGSKNTGVVFLAVAGQGVYAHPMNDKDKPQQVKVSATSDVTQAKLCESVESGHTKHSESEKLAKEFGLSQPSVRMDSQAKYCVVARGEADIYLRLPTSKEYREKIWDHAGGYLVVTEAGGKVTDVYGKPLDFTRGEKLEDNQGVIVTNGKLHERVLSGVRGLLG